MTKRVCFSTLPLVVCCVGIHAATPAIIPQPVSMLTREGVFLITADTSVVAAEDASAEADKLIAALAPTTGFRLKRVDRASGGATIVLALDGGLRIELGDEGYRLDVTPGRIDIRAAGPAGLFYGSQTLRQLLPTAVPSPKRKANLARPVPCLSVTDYPRFEWRGLLIDPARHFIPAADVKHYIDAMAMHKFNRLQMHLTDNEGWRVEIKKYPKLTELGSDMDWTLRYRKGEGRRRFGFYTQEDIRELVRYAAGRHVTIVPEIEMPYHAGSAIVAYPEHGVNMKHLAELPVEKRWWVRGGDWRPNSGLLGARPETVTFMQDILTEVIDLFPSEFVHIGGDEANLKVWANDPEMQALMKTLGCQNAHELHSWFIKQMDAFLTKKGRRMVGWDEILQGGLAPGATVMSWRGVGRGIAAAKAGHDVVMAPTSHTYFDYRQAPGELGLGRRVITMEKVYTFDPIPDALNAEEAKHVLGGQGQLWGELISDAKRRDFMTWPRACALSEVLWSPRRDRRSQPFFPRLLEHRKRLQAAEIHFRPLDNSLVKRASASPMDFDYFRNNWNVIGLKDYRRGARVMPDNRLQLAETAVEIRVGRSLLPLGRKHGKLVQDGWLPIILIAANDGPVRYDIKMWATPLPTVKDWQRAFDWPTEGENFLNWIQVKATNTGDREAKARVKTSSPRAEAAGAFDWTLKPGGSSVATVRVPFSAVKDATVFADADPDMWLDRTAQYWKGALSEAAHIEVPCRKATEALLAAHVCQLIANDHGDVHGGEGFYDEFYIRDGAYQVMELEEAGLWDAAKKAVALYLPRQRSDGRFESQKGQFDANGQAVWVLWQYYKMTADRAWLESVYPRMRKAVDWTMKARRQAPADSPFAGVLPNALADGEFLWGGKHHIVGYDFWNLRGMLCTADAARILGKKAEAEELMKEADLYRDALDAAWKRTGLAHFPPSWEKAGTHWGNTETLWPTEIFERDDPRIAALSSHVREDFHGGFIEGTIQWHGHAPAIHPYMGAYTTMADLTRGEHEDVVRDFYWYLLHSTAAHAFPEGIYEKKREAWNNTIPHVTGACNYAIMLRHMLVHEEGDELHLLKAVPDWWLNDGQRITIKRLPTHFGMMALTVHGTKEGVKIAFDRPTRERPERLVLHLPPSRRLLTKLDGVDVVTRSNQQNRWDFPTVVALYEESDPPALWVEPDALSLTTGKPVTCSTALPPYPARQANDGYAGNTDKYWATDVQQMKDPRPWWQVDLEEPTTVGRVVVVAYYGTRRYYGFTVETSLDGETWEMVADLLGNKALSTREGHTCRFEPRPVRYLRVTQMHNSANTGRHLVEVMAFGE